MTDPIITFKTSYDGVPSFTRAEEKEEATAEITVEDPSSAERENGIPSSIDPATGNPIFLNYDTLLLTLQYVAHDNRSTRNARRVCLLWRNTIDSFVLKKLSKLGVQRRKKADLSDKKLHLFPELGILRFSQLQYVDLSHNQIKYIPDSISRLSQLQHIELSHNKIKHIPDSINGLSKLKILNLACNQIETFPDLKLPQLESLHLSHNLIEQVPRSVEALSMLQSIDLSHNHLTEIADTIGSLRQLAHLDLSYNQISELPDTIGNLSSLRNLELSFNQLSHIPATLGSIPRLRSLDVRHNQLHQLPSEIDYAFQTTDLMVFATDNPGFHF